MMKKPLIALLTLLLLTIPSPAAWAQEDIQLVINGLLVTPSEPPLMLKEHVYVPMRYVGEYLEAEVEYVAATKTDTAHVVMTKDIGDGMLEQATMYYGDRAIGVIYSIDDQRYSLEQLGTQAMTLINNTSYIPLRAAAETLHCWVDWQADTRTVIITERSVEKAALLQEIKWADGSTTSGDLQQDAEALKTSLEEAQAQAESLKSKIEALENSELFQQLQEKQDDGEWEAQKEQLEADKEQLNQWKQELQRLQKLISS